MYTKEDSHRIGHNMKLLRISEGLTQNDLCNQLFLTRTTYLSYENGAKVADLKTIDALSNFYNVSFDSLVTKDLSDRYMHTIFFGIANEEEREVMQDYDKLSSISKDIITELINTLQSREMAYYSNYFHQEKKTGNRK
jgi:transcriptional regulator with XRE-family HTH domain